MPITGLPTFTSGILTAAQLNAIVTALEEKFAGKVTTGDFTWPLTAGGDINMGQYNLLNVGKFWSVYDASGRAAGATLQSVIDAAETDGGGVVLFPAGYTETLPAGGITVPTKVSLVGDGLGSVIVQNASASTTGITVESGADWAGLRGLRLQGVSGVNRTILEINNSDHVRIADVQFDTHGTSPFLSVVSGSTDVSVNRCRFIGLGTVAQSQVSLTGSEGVRFTNCRFQDWGDMAISAVPAVAAPVSATMIRNCRFIREESTGSSVTAPAAVYFNNSNAVGSVGFTFAGNEFKGDGANKKGLWISGGGLSGVVIHNNEIMLNTTSPAILVHNDVIDMSITDNRINNKGGDGVVIGLDAGTEGSGQTATKVLHWTFSGNKIQARSATAGDGVGLLIAPYTTSAGLRAAITANSIISHSGDAFAIWNVGTTRPLFTTVAGNSCMALNSSYKGFASYQDMGATNNGDIGTAAISWWFTMVGNNINGAASGTDYTHSTANKCVVRNNNA